MSTNGLYPMNNFRVVKVGKKVKKVLTEAAELMQCPQSYIATIAIETYCEALMRNYKMEDTKPDNSQPSNQAA